MPMGSQPASHPPSELDYSAEAGAGELGCSAEAGVGELGCSVKAGAGELGCSAEAGAGELGCSAETGAGELDCSAEAGEGVGARTTRSCGSVCQPSEGRYNGRCSQARPRCTPPCSTDPSEGEGAMGKGMSMTTSACLACLPACLLSSHAVGPYVSGTCCGTLCQWYTLWALMSVVHVVGPYDSGTPVGHFQSAGHYLPCAPTCPLCPPLRPHVLLLYAPLIPLPPTCLLPLCPHT